jgi:hypothetical protein
MPRANDRLNAQGEVSRMRTLLEQKRINLREYNGFLRARRPLVCRHTFIVNVSVMSNLASEEGGGKVAQPTRGHGENALREGREVQFMDDPLLENLVQFCMRDEFQEKFFWFCNEYCMFFAADEEEHKIEYTEYHRLYMDEFEVQIAEFLKQENIDDKQFFLRCRTAQSRDAKAAHYLNVFLASIEYESFYELMVRMKQRRLLSEELSPPTSPTDVSKNMSRK